MIHDKLDNFQIGKAIQIRSGEKVAIFSTGAICDQVIEAEKTLKEKGINPAIYSFPTVKPIDQQTIELCARQFELIVTVEEHNIVGGFGSGVADIISSLSGERSQLLKIGLEDQYSAVVGTQMYLRDIYGMSATKIVSKIGEALHA